MSSESEPVLQVASLEEIRDAALVAAAYYRGQANGFQATFQTEWQRLRANLRPEGEWWVSDVPKAKDFYEFHDRIVEADSGLSDDYTNHLDKLARSRRDIHHDWINIATYMLHDVCHLRPIWSIQMSAMIDNRTMKRNRLEMHERHVAFFSTLADYSGVLAETLAFPCDFLAAKTSMDLGEPIPVETYHLAEDLERIALHIVGRFAVDDYDIIVNNPMGGDTVRNQFHIQASEDLLISAHRGMLFQVIYNLAKNAAKANAIKHYDEHDQAGPKLYYKGGILEHPRRLALQVEEDPSFITVSVLDEGGGMSLDESFARMQRELTNRITEFGIESVVQSEWFANIQKMLGKKQAQLFLAWPQDPFAIRGLNVGSLIDCQFVAGFSGDWWNLRGLTSGMGLWGVKYITDHLGGFVVGTNTKEQGALFSIVLPKSSVGLPTPIWEPWVMRRQAARMHVRI